MTIRRATRDDVDAVRRIAERSWRTDYPEILTRETAEEGVAEWYAPDRIAAELDDDRTLVLVAEREGTVVGFAHAAWNDDGEGYVLRTYVDPDRRREGAGRELLEAACDALRERGVERINATVLAENDPGNAFYRGFGFEYVDERETTIGDGSYRENRYVLDG